MHISASRLIGCFVPLSQIFRMRKRGWSALSTFTSLKKTETDSRYRYNCGWCKDQAQSWLQELTGPNICWCRLMTSLSELVTEYCIAETCLSAVSQVSFPYKPYFYVACSDRSEKEVAAYLTKKFSGKIAQVDFIQKEDLDLVCRI